MSKGKVINESVKSAIDDVMLFRIIRKISTPFEDMEAFKLGIIDKDGNVLRKRKTLKTAEEQNAFTLIDLFVVNIKKLLGKAGKSRFLTITGSLFLLREFNNYDENELDSFNGDFLKFLKEGNYKKEALLLETKFNEIFIDEEIVNSIGDGSGVAGTVDDPIGKKSILGVAKRKRKRKECQKVKKEFDDKVSETIKRIKRLKPLFCEKNIMPKTMIKTFERFVDNDFLEFDLVVDKTVNSEEVLIGNVQGKDFTIIEFIVSDEDDKIFFDSKKWDFMVETIAKYTRTKKKLDFFEEGAEYKLVQNYLSGSIRNQSKIISKELFKHFDDIGKLKKGLYKLDKNIINKSQTLLRYLTIFNFDFKHPTLLKLLKLVFINFKLLQKKNK